MSGYLFGRFVQAVLVVLGVILIVFLLSRVVPGGEARAVLGPRATVARCANSTILVVQAAENTDVPLVLGTTLVATVATVTGSLLADVLSVLADPRIRYTGLSA